MEMYLAMIAHHQERSASAYKLAGIYRKLYAQATTRSGKLYFKRHFDRVSREARKSATLARQMVMELINK